MIEALRAELDAVDDALIDVLARRSAIVAQIWAHKRATGVAVEDVAREQAVIARLVARGRAVGLDGGAVREVVVAVVGRDLRPSS